MYVYYPRPSVTAPLPSYVYPHHVNSFYKTQPTAKYRTVASVPTDPHEQLHLAIRAVFDSWMTPRAIRYRSVCVLLFFFVCVWLD